MTQLLVRDALVVATVDDERRELEGGWVAITDGLVQARRRRRPTRRPTPTRVLDAERLPRDARARSTRTITSTRTSPAASGPR